MKTVALRKKNKRDKERAKLNKLVKKRATTKKRISKLKTKTADGSPRPLSKVRSAIQKKRLKKIQSKINQNPRAQADRKAAAKKKTTPPRGGKKIMIKKHKLIDKTPRGGKKKKEVITPPKGYKRGDGTKKFLKAVAKDPLSVPRAFGQSLKHVGKTAKRKVKKALKRR